MTQADFGRLEIDLAEAEMPGLMACRTEFGAKQPFKGECCRRLTCLLLGAAQAAPVPSESCICTRSRLRSNPPPVDRCPDRWLPAHDHPDGGAD
jgi:hypothetical protein